MAANVVTFRESFPEFSDALVYPPAEVNFWLTLGTKLLSVERWGNVFDFGQMLFVAHNLSLQFSAKQNARAGQQPGQVIGAITSASVDKVSYSRDASAAMDPSNGHWNLSTYGIRYIQLVRMMGAGPVYVGAPTANDGASAFAWPGPMPGPW